MDYVFLSLVVSSASTVCLACVGFLYKSKCDQIEMPCLKIHRNVELEEKVDELELNKKPETNI
jgi:hypothetical protein